MLLPETHSDTVTYALALGSLDHWSPPVGLLAEITACISAQQGEKRIRERERKVFPYRKSPVEAKDVDCPIVI